MPTMIAPIDPEAARALADGGDEGDDRTLSEAPTAPMNREAVRALVEAAEQRTRSEAQEPAAPAPPPDIPDVVVERALGSGGMGTVFRGRSVSLDRPVAIKVIHPELARSESFVVRFEREARALAKLSHPNIVTCYQAGQGSHGERYLLMELVEGEDLLTWVRDHGVLAERDALALARQIADALAYARERGVIHRDVKPENVLVQSVSARGARGSALGAKLVDLGIASFRTDNTRITHTGTILGSPLTMAPEQAEAPESVDHRADIYALGATLYFALTGRYPHDGATPGEVLAAKLKKEATPPHRHRPDLSTASSELVQWMLRYSVRNRPQTYDDLIEALDAILENRAGPSGTARISTTDRGSRGKWTLLGLAAFGALATGVLVVHDRQRRASDPGPETTRPELVQAAATPSRELTTSASLRGDPTLPETSVGAMPVVPVVSRTTTTDVPVAPPPADPPSLAWSTPRTILGGAGPPLVGWERTPPSSFQEAEESGVCDGVAEGRNELAVLDLKEVPASPWRLRGGFFPRNAREVGVRLAFEAQQIDLAIQPLNEGTYILRLARSDDSRRERLALLTLTERVGPRRELALVHADGTLWGRLDGGPSAEGKTWAVARVPGQTRKLGLYVKRGAASFDTFTLESAGP